MFNNKQKSITIVWFSKESSVFVARQFKLFSRDKFFKLCIEVVKCIEIDEQLEVVFCVCALR